MTTINFGHTFISGDTAATVTVSGVTNLTSLDMSSLTKVKTVEVVNNDKLATIIAPSSTVLAEPIAAIAVTVTGNALTGNFDYAQRGTETTSYVLASIESDDLTTLKSFIAAYAAQDGRTASSVSATSGIANITHNIDIDVVTINGGTTTNTLSAAMVANDTLHLLVTLLMKVQIKQTIPLTILMMIQEVLQLQMKWHLLLQSNLLV